MEHELLIWFCNPNANSPVSTVPELAFDLSSTSNQLSTDFWFEGEMVESMSISRPMLTNVEKTISLKVKNPLNFMADYSTIVNAAPFASTTNPMGTAVPGTWNNVVVSDGEFIVFKGSKADFGALSDTERTKALLGTFYIEKVSYDEFEQTYTITGRDAMALARRWAIWRELFRFPPKGTPFGTELYAGQIIHYLFHWMGCWHLHKDGTYDRTFVAHKGTYPDYGLVNMDDMPVVGNFYSTNMSFIAKDSWADEQIADNKLIGDIWNTFLQYTGYKIYVRDEIVNGQPRPVFIFEPPAYKLYSIGDPSTDDTLNLFGSYTVDSVTHHVAQLNTLFYPPTETHWNPITITGLTHEQDVDPLRYAIKVAVKGKTVYISDDQFIGVQRMRAGKDRVGVVVEATIDEKYCSSIAEAILFQVRELYSTVTVEWSDAIKFAPRLYDFNIDEQPNGIKIQVNGKMQCTKNEIKWSGTRYSTSTSFTPSSMLNAAYAFPKPSITGTAGDGEVALSWTRYEENDKSPVYTYVLEQWDKK